MLGVGVHALPAPLELPAVGCPICASMCGCLRMHDNSAIGMVAGAAECAAQCNMSFITIVAYLTASVCLPQGQVPRSGAWQLTMAEQHLQEHKCTLWWRLN